MGFYSPLPLHRRDAIECEIETLLQRVELLIARLDDADGDPDLEEDDWPGTVLDKGEGDDDDGRGILPTLPIYGLDQSRGPVNVAEANRAWRAADTGLVQRPGGGWGYPQ